MVPLVMILHIGSYRFPNKDDFQYDPNKEAVMRSLTWFWAGVVGVIILRIPQLSAHIQGPCSDSKPQTLNPKP